MIEPIEFGHFPALWHNKTNEQIAFKTEIL
jgi:hypothetical protein